jgi:endonuclease-8
VSDDEALRVVREAGTRMRRAVAGPGYEPSPSVYEKAGRPCSRCGTTVRSRGQGDGNRTTYWCPGCQT